MVIPLGRSIQVNGPFLLISLQTWTPFFLVALCVMIGAIAKLDKMSFPMQIVMLGQFVVLSLTPNITNAVPWKWVEDNRRQLLAKLVRNGF